MNTKQFIMSLGALALSINANAQEWSNVSIPANAGNGNTWELVPAASDDFSYNFNETNQRSNFGNNKWYNFYHNAWDGPGTTYWKYNHVSVDGDDLVLRASRWNANTQPQPITGLPNKMGRPQDGVNAGCITSNTRVLYPVFVEAKVSVADIVLASDVWLLSPDDTQEIDIIECYGGNEQGNAFFSEFIHLSHHSFIRQPFTDYQPRDFNSWWGQAGVDNWGEYHWNNGNRRYVRIGVNWISPFHFEYYIDGQVVRVLYDKAVATNRNGTWTYAYPTMTNGVLDSGSDGFQRMTTYATGTSYNFATLQAASNTSSVSIIDPYNFQGGNGFTKELDIIVNVESQNWHVDANRTPTDAQLANPARNTMKVDWIRTYKPVQSNNSVAVTGVTLTPKNISITAGNTGNVTGAVSPSNATVKTMTFTSSNPAIATVNQSGVITAISAGNTTITATSTDGSFTDTTTVTVTALTTPGQTPFGGTASPIPGTINAVNFDNGGQGIAYNDTTTGNVGSGARQNTDVDTENRISSGNVGWIATGEWLEYTVNVASAGNYNIEVQVASNGNNGAYHIEFNGNDVTGVQDVNTTGGWGNFITQTINNVSLAAGQQVMRVFMDGGSFNLGNMTFTTSGNNNSGNSPETFVIEAEDFATTGGTFNDAFAGGPGLGVNPTNNIINYVNSGDFTTYNVNVPGTGTYAIEYLIATPSNNAQIQLLVDGTVINTTNVPNNGSWNNFNSLSGGTINLTEGNHTFRVNASGSNQWQWNLDKLTFTPTSGSKLITNVIETLSVNPNPAVFEAYIIGLLPELTYDYNLYDITGNYIASGKINASKNTIDISAFSNGVYFLNITSETSQKVLKIIINN